MSDFKCDSDRLADDGKKIINIINNYQKNVNEIKLRTFCNFFMELQNLTVNQVWNGNDAELYVRTVSSDKQEFVDYGNGIKELGNEMIDFADSLERKVVTTEREFNNNY